MADYPIRQVSDFLAAEGLLLDAIGAKSRSDDRLRFVRLSRQTSVRRAGAVLATLEVALETGIFSVNSGKPIDAGIVRAFVAGNSATLRKTLPDSAWKFLFHFMTGETLRSGYERHLSFGRISGAIELSEHLIGNEKIISMLDEKETTAQYLTGVALGTVRALRALARRENPDQGLIDFEVLIRNLFYFTRSDAENLNHYDRESYNAVLECIRPLLGNRVLPDITSDKSRQSSDSDVSFLSFWDDLKKDLNSMQAFEGQYADDVVSWSQSSFAQTDEQTRPTDFFDGPRV